MKKRLLVLSSPSGGGKTTIAKKIFELFPQLGFSVSATSRQIREGEINGKDYYFITKQEFEQKISDNELIEFEIIFGNYYGTLKSQVQNALDNNRKILFDVDVKGALSLNRHFPDDTLLIFIEPPNVETLEKRLRGRSSESEEQIKLRLDRAKLELGLKSNFEFVVVNDDLKLATDKVKKIIDENM